MTSLIYNPQIPEEAGIAAFIQHISVTSRHEGYNTPIITAIPIKKGEDGDKIPKYSDGLWFLGTYWSEIVDRFYPSLTTETSDKVQFHRTNVDEGPTPWEWACNGPLATFPLCVATNITKKNKKLLKFLKRKYLGTLKDGASHPFFAGAYTISPDFFTAITTILREGEGDKTFTKFTNSGKIISDSQRQLVRKRVEDNSTLFISEGGVNVACTCAPDLIGMSHEFLKLKYPESDVTMVTYPIFNQKGHIFQKVSYRAITDKIDIKKFIQYENWLDGDGSSIIGGGSFITNELWKSIPTSATH